VEKQATLRESALRAKAKGKETMAKAAEKGGKEVEKELHFRMLATLVVRSATERLIVGLVDIRQTRSSTTNRTWSRRPKTNWRHRVVIMPVECGEERSEGK